MRLVPFLIGLLLSAAVAAQLAPQKSTAGGVTVAVTPGSLAGQVWSFDVVLDTHSQDLSDDVAKSALLRDGKGKEARPLAWEGAPPGGHHRKGVLKFAAIEPRPALIELHINRPGEAKPRVFRWTIGKEAL
jgi:hypothetical protein